MFLATVYGGIGIGLLYDGNRILRRALHAGRGVSAAADVVFWLAALALMAALLYWAESGTLRAYMLLGFACGWGVYELAISPLIQAAHRFLLRQWQKLKQTPFGKRMMK